MAEKTIAILGGGAAGLAAAIASASVLSREARHGGDAVRVVVYEADNRVGRSILRSGNGRCNFTNSAITRKVVRLLSGESVSGESLGYHNEEFVLETLLALEEKDERYRGGKGAKAEGSDAVRRLFADLGMLTREEGDGRCYPMSGKAATVLNVLRDAIADLGVEVLCDASVACVEPRRSSEGEEPSRFLLRLKDGRIEHANHVIVATGGNTAQRLLSLVEGLEYRETTPMLSPLGLVEADIAKRMDNVRVKCRASLLRDNNVIAKENGEVLFRKYGISGIVVFNLSRVARPGDTLRLELLGEPGAVTTQSRLMTARKRLGSRFGCQVTCERLLRGVLQEPVADVVLARAQCDPDAVADKDAVGRIAHTIDAFDSTIAGVGDATLAQVHRGGFVVGAPHGIPAATLEVPAVPNLAIVGEALDVDGPCGGYNLHWAWASGMLAGYCAAEAMLAL